MFCGVAGPKTCGAGKKTTYGVLTRSLELAELGLLPTIKWDAGFGPTWQPGEAGAAARLKQFVTRAMDAYADARNLPDRDGTSMLSPWLHFGELSPRQVWAAVEARSKESGVFPSSNGARVFLSEIGWRECAHHLRFHETAAHEKHPLSRDGPRAE